MTIKIILGLILIGGSGLIGNLWVKKTLERKKLLYALQDAAMNLYQGICFKRETCMEALILADRLLPGVFEPCARLMKNQPNLTGRQICIRVLRKKNGILEALKIEEQQAFFDFMEALTQAEADYEIKEARERFDRQLKEELEHIEKEELKRARLIRRMCLFAGMGIAIVAL